MEARIKILVGNHELLNFEISEYHWFEVSYRIMGKIEADTIVPGLSTYSFHRFQVIDMPIETQKSWN